MATDKPRSIVTYVHRPMRQPRKKAQATVITDPTIGRRWSGLVC